MQTLIKSLQPPSEWLLSMPFYRWENRGTSRLINLASWDLDQGSAILEPGPSPFDLSHSSPWLPVCCHMLRQDNEREEIFIHSLVTNWEAQWWVFPMNFFQKKSWAADNQISIVSLTAIGWAPLRSGDCSNNFQHYPLFPWQFFKRTNSIPLNRWENWGFKD